MSLTRKEYATQKEKKKDFWLGFWLWWATNLVLLLGVGLGLTRWGNRASRRAARSTL